MSKERTQTTNVNQNTANPQKGSPTKGSDERISKTDPTTRKNS